MSMTEYEARRARLGFQKTMPVCTWSKEALALAEAERDEMRLKVAATMKALEADRELLARLQQMRADEHNAKGAEKTRRIISRVAQEHGFTYEQLIGTIRTAPLVKARHAAMVAVCKGHPHYSLVMVGRAFLRDHTSIMHVICKHCAATGETLRGWTPETASRRIEGIKRGNRNAIMKYDRCCLPETKP
jgi:chromosomal replication initiation ATPase DnaA